MNTMQLRCLLGQVCQCHCADAQYAHGCYLWMVLQLSVQYMNNVCILLFFDLEGTKPNDAC